MEMAMTTTPPRATGLLWRWLTRGAATPWGKDPREYRPEAIEELYVKYQKYFGEGCYFEVDHRGWEHVPEPPAMLVSNHSGGTSLLDVFAFLEGWYRRFGVRRPLHPLAHEVLLSNSVTGPFMSRCGILHADEAIAQEALLAHREDVIVFPGSDRDAWRPYSKRYEVRFSGRTGYARLALKTGVSVIPVANAGIHDTMIVLTDGQWLARWMRVHALSRAHIFPIHLSIPWGLAIGPWPHLPLPTRLRYRVGPAVPPPEGAKPGADPDKELVIEYDRRVQAAIQKLLHELRDEDPRK